MFPALAGRMRPSDPARSLNGMFSFTPDGGSVVGESAAVRGVWVCEAVWVTHAAGMARQVVEWMVTGEPSYDLAEADANRFYPFQTSPALRASSAGSSSTARSTTSSIRCSSRRSRGSSGSRRSTARHEALGAEFFTGAGWERPQWFRANRELVGGVTHEWARRTGWAARGWSPEVGAEHLATRSNAAPVRHHAVREVRRGRARRARVPRADLREPDRPAGGLDRVHGRAHADAAGSGSTSR